MGIIITNFISKNISNYEYFNVIVLGIDNSGKTSLLQILDFQQKIDH